MKRPRPESNGDGPKAPDLKSGAIPLCDGGINIRINQEVLKVLFD